MLLLVEVEGAARSLAALTHQVDGAVAKLASPGVLVLQVVSHVHEVCVGEGCLRSKVALVRKRTAIMLA